MNRIFATILAAALAAMPAAAIGPQREFRGAWIQTVWQMQYKTRTTAQNRQVLCRQLDSLQTMGVNAVIFQVRPQADAFYDSRIEPWSCYLTQGGAAPKPFWDPLQFMVDECHRRGMELHAWLNPYRVTSNIKQISELPKDHIYRKAPGRFVRYGGKLYFDPGIPENRAHIVKVVRDIVSRYDVDGIHFDDYFYPYPDKGKPFPDAASYAKYGKGMNRGDWRRHNVDLLIKEVHNAIVAIKPWVRFGISPFGIYRNQKTDPSGSATSGLETYDSLYADVLLWEREGWIDYLMPQLYWNLDHKAASYRVLVDWWGRNAGKNRHLIVGQDVVRSMKNAELGTKITMARQRCTIAGNCWWPAGALTANTGGAADSLAARWQAKKTLGPSYPWICDRRPDAVKGLKPVSDHSFRWNKAKCEGRTSDAVKYAVYRFESIAELEDDGAGELVGVTPENSYEVFVPGVYVVTAIDRVNNESEMSSPLIIR